MEGPKNFVTKGVVKKFVKIPSNLRKWIKTDNYGSKITYTAKNDSGDKVQNTLKLIAFKCPMSDAFD